MQLVIVGMRHQDAFKNLKPTYKDKVVLVKEPHNPVDKDAVAVHFVSSNYSIPNESNRIGYVRIKDQPLLKDYNWSSGSRSIYAYVFEIRTMRLNYLLIHSDAEVYSADYLYSLKNTLNYTGTHIPDGDELSSYGVDTRYCNDLVSTRSYIDKQPTIVAGTNVSITTDKDTNTITISSGYGGGGVSSENSYGGGGGSSKDSYGGGGSSSEGARGTGRYDGGGDTYACNSDLKKSNYQTESNKTTTKQESKKMNIGNMRDSFFKEVKNVALDMQSGKLGVVTKDGIITATLDGVSVNPITDMGFNIPAFAMRTPIEQLSKGDIIISSGDPVFFVEGSKVGYMTITTSGVIQETGSVSNMFFGKNTVMAVKNMFGAEGGNGMNPMMLMMMMGDDKAGSDGFDFKKMMMMQMMMGNQGSDAGQMNPMMMAMMMSKM